MVWQISNYFYFSFHYYRIQDHYCCAHIVRISLKHTHFPFEIRTCVDYNKQHQLRISKQFGSSEEKNYVLLTDKNKNLISSLQRTLVYLLTPHPAVISRSKNLSLSLFTAWSSSSK